MGIEGLAWWGMGQMIPLYSVFALRGVMVLHGREMKNRWRERE